MPIVLNREQPPVASPEVIRAEPIKIKWDSSLPIFAKEEFLRAVGDEYGWLGGIDESGALRCILPYTILHKAGLRMVRFRNETIPCDHGIDLLEEKSFLNHVIQYFRKIRMDVIIPATNNSIFRTFPDGADAAPYGTYAIDLQQPDDVLWKNIGKITRQNISTAQKDGVLIREGLEYLEPAYNLIRETFSRSKLEFMNYDAFHRFAHGLGENGKLLKAEYQSIAQSYCLFGFSNYCAYAIYAGNIFPQHQGAIKLMQWEAIRLFRSFGVRKFDFVGARINPEKGSKQDSINMMKKRFGAILSEGYMWKYSLRPWRSFLYSIGVRLLRGGDIVDQEAHKLKEYVPLCQISDKAQ
jgi:hypothetical protein